MPFESSITKSILNYLNSLPDCIAEKVKGDSTASGRADINGCFQGRAFRVEVKTPDNRNEASTRQKINLRKWYNSGAIVMVTYSLSFVKQVFPEKAQTSKRFCIKYKEARGCVSWVKYKGEKR